MGLKFGFFMFIFNIIIGLIYIVIYFFYYFDNLQFEIPPDETIADLNNYDANRQQDEILKCTRSFSYFCHKFVKILHPTRGLIPFIMFKYQKKYIDNDNQYLKYPNDYLHCGE